MFIQPQRGLDRTPQRSSVRKSGVPGKSAAVGRAEFVNPAFTEVARGLEALLDGMPEVRDQVVSEGRKFLQDMPEYPDAHDIARLSAAVSQFLSRSVSPSAESAENHNENP